MSLYTERNVGSKEDMSNVGMTFWSDHSKDYKDLPFKDLYSPIRDPKVFSTLLDHQNQLELKILYSNYGIDTNMVGLVLFGILSYATVISGNIPLDPIINVTTTLIDTLLTASFPTDPPVQETTVDNNNTTIIVVPPIEIIPTTTDNQNYTTTTEYTNSTLSVPIITDPIIIGPIITSIPILPTNDNDSSSFESPANPCAYYGSGQCCPQLTPMAAPIEEGFSNGQMYVTFLPKQASRNVDNICYTLHRLPDGCNTFQLFASTVYFDGTNTVDTSIVTQNSLGTFLMGSPQCTCLDILFGSVLDTVLQCDTSVVYRCVLNGECPGLPRAISEPVIGVSFQRRRIPRGCWGLINNVILSNGLENQDFISLPMKLPSRCVYAQTCAVTPVVQLFQETARFNYNQRPTCP